MKLAEFHFFAAALDELLFLLLLPCRRCFSRKVGEGGGVQVEVDSPIG